MIFVANASLAFEDSAALAEWRDANHATVGELWVRIYEKCSGRPSLTWTDCVIEALRFGGIDGQKTGGRRDVLPAAADTALRTIELVYEELRARRAADRGRTHDGCWIVAGGGGASGWTLGDDVGRLADDLDAAGLP
jgi:hypothetical protein